jgi:tryptophan 2,3-dioxygenase
LEAVLGRRDNAGAEADKSSGMGMAEHLIPGSPARSRVEQAMSRRSVWDSALHYFNSRQPLPQEVLDRDVTKAWTPDEAVQAVLVEIHRLDPEAAMIGEAMVDLDEGLQEWRYRHVKMVERTIGRKMGTGGSAGVGYLSSTLFNPVFPDLWAIRSKF